MEMSGLDYALDVNPDPRKAPKKKFPVLSDAGQVIPDSDQIRDHLEVKYGVDFDAGLSAEQKAVSRMVIRALGKAIAPMLRAGTNAGIKTDLRDLPANSTAAQPRIRIPLLTALFCG